ncbi:MAG: DUF2059 domain-containing protein, partial [Xanthobacteraceae bacterium]
AVAAPAFAQAPAANPSPSPAAILIAKQILQLKDTKQNIYTPLVRGVIEKAKDEFMQTNFMWAKDLNEVAANMEKQYAPRADELLDAAARIYASHFTEAELRQILAWDQSPVGKKEMAEEPKILHDSLAQAGEWGQNFSLEVINQMRAEMKKRGHDI